MSQRSIRVLAAVALLASLLLAGARTASAASPATLSIGDTTIVEGNDTLSRTARLPVTLSDPQGTDVVVSYSTTVGSASPGSDYVAKSNGTVKIRAGKVAALISVKTVPDTTAEPTETFTVTLTNAPSGVTLARSTGTVTILDDDPPGAGPQWSVGDATIAEGDTGPAAVAKVPVRLSTPFFSDTTITYTTEEVTATSNRDYVAKATQTIKIGARKVAAEIPIKVVADDNHEGAETLTVTLSSPSLGTISRAVGTVTIIDNDPPGEEHHYPGGSLYGSGLNATGQLGDGTTTDRTTPGQIGTDDDWFTVTAGGTHSCGIRSNGTLWCWGNNSSGQLGDGTTTTRTSPVQIGTDTDWTSLESGDEYTCGIRTDATLWCWGSNVFGELGDGTVIDRHRPVQVGTGTDWATVSAGQVHTCGTRTDGTLWCWGNKDDGRLGDGSNLERHSPKRIGKATDWASVSAGFAHTCAIRTSGALWCWGLNASGGLGDGTTTDHDKPTQVGSATWRSVSTGGETTCAVATAGSLWCWGYNAEGEVGDGTTVNRSTPVQVGTDVNWVATTSFDLTNCGIRTDGTLWCWGYNGRGQLGDGTTDDRSTPVQAGSGTTWRVVSVGDVHTVGIED